MAVELAAMSRQNRIATFAKPSYELLTHALCVTNMEQATYRAYICCGPNCGPKGSRLLLDELEQEIERQGLSERVQVLPTGCQSHCASGPTMVVYPGPVFYQEMDALRLRRIVVEHFREDHPVAAYFWQGEGWRGTVGKREPVQPFPSMENGRQNPAVTPRTPREAQKPKPQRRYDVDDFKW